MLQIEEAFRQFLNSGTDPFGVAERELDRHTIDKVGDRSALISDRIFSLRKWWSSYGVARNLREGEHEPVAKRFIEHFDQRQSAGQLLAPSEIISEFHVFDDLSKPDRPYSRDRRITSLISKTLWVFYPDAAPIYDAQAFCALRVLSRLYAFRVDPSQGAFAQFVEAWYQGFERVQFLIPQDESMPHKTRVFDAFLWWLGQGTFGSLDT